jgi:hypothetical protein
MINPPIIDYEIQEHSNNSFSIAVTDRPFGMNVTVNWFKNAVLQLTDVIVSGGESVWNWITGYTDSGEYNITANATNYYNDTVSISWNITVNDTYLAPSDPVEVVSSSGLFDYSIPLFCGLDYVPVSPFYFDWVYSLDGVSFVGLNKNLSVPYYEFDISNYVYGTNFTFGCRVISPSGTSGFTYSNSFIRVRMNHFYLSSLDYGSYQSKVPYTLSVVSSVQNTIGATLVGQLADCNGDGIWDYSWDYRRKSITEAKNSFTCVNVAGKVETTIGMVLFKNNTESWESINCKGLNKKENYCVIYKTYELTVT